MREILSLGHSRTDALTATDGPRTIQFMGRDLLYKPPTPAIIPEEEEGENQTKKGKTDGAKRLGLHQTQTVDAATKAELQADKTQQGPTRAYRAAYFTKDTSGVNFVNQRQTNMEALRGAKGATDLKKVVLPGGETYGPPDPGTLRVAGDLMNLGDVDAVDLQGLLQRQGGWTRGEGVTAELLQQRMEQLKEMIEARKASLARMKQAGKLPDSVTVVQAHRASGKALEEAEDVAAQGTVLIQRTAKQATEMHTRLAKMLQVAPMDPEKSKA